MLSTAVRIKKDNEISGRGPMNRVLACVLVLLCSAGMAEGQASDGGNVWNTLAAPAMDPTKYAVTENVEIVRDRVHINLVSGNIQFLKPANGVVFAAVFRGEGHVLVDPPNPTEAQQLKLFTRQEKLAASFTEATFTFSDGLLEEVEKQVKWKDSPGGNDLYAKRQQEREDIGGEYLPRIFKSVMSPDRKRTAYFLADLKTKEAGWIHVQDDAMQPEEIRVGRWVDVGPFKLRDNWMIFPAGGRDPRHVYDDPAERQDFLLPSYKITASVTEGAELGATANVTVNPRYAGERILLFELDSNLRLSGVKDEKGRDLEYHQARERKENSQSYGNYVAVVLNDPTQAGQPQTLRFVYQGKHVVNRVGNGNYYCKSFGWYPSAFSSELGVDEFAFRSDFELNFRSPKKYTLVATGRKAGETTDGKESLTTWKSEIPLAAAGFAFGDYKVVTDKVGDVEIQVYANNQPDDLLTSIQRRFDNPLSDLAAGPGGSHASSQTAAIGNLTPSALGKTINVEAGNTLRVFQSYFGPYPYKQLAITNIIGSYGQGWPGLLYLGWFTFLDSTQRNALGIRNQTQLTDFFRGHESSHQWWGHRVGWKSYHDQWLSEGFAEFSGLLYVQYRENMKESLTQWRLDKEHLNEPDLNNHKTETLGPIWMGQRIRSSVTSGGSYQNLIYSKGGYVLQMIRMQMTDPRNPDQEHIFKETMRDYCKTFDNKPASTEDFKAIVEKHMTRSMDLDGNHKMDWFFNEYVYGTERPQYTFHASVTATPDGKSSVKGTLQRTGVPGNWKDVVPLYAHIGDKIVRLGAIAATHDTETLNVVIPQKIDKLSINEYEDLLADVKQ
jgi:peptidase M1-like protein